MPLTSEELVSQYAELHTSQLYGASCHEFSLQIQVCLLELKPKIVLEYGCGQSNLFEMLELEQTEWVRYDPAIPVFSELKTRHADLVVNTDVMEHIPEQDIDEVLAHIKSLSDNVFFNISTRLANQILPSGENAHCTVWSDEKWLRKLREHFPQAQIVHSRPNDSILVITWNSPVGGLISAIEHLKEADCKSVKDHFFRRSERNSRTKRVTAASNHRSGLPEYQTAAELSSVGRRAETSGD